MKLNHASPVKIDVDSHHCAFACLAFSSEHKAHDAMYRVQISRMYCVHEPTL